MDIETYGILSQQGGGGGGLTLYKHNCIFTLSKDGFEYSAMIPVFSSKNTSLTFDDVFNYLGENTSWTFAGTCKNIDTNKSWRYYSVTINAFHLSTEYGDTDIIGSQFVIVNPQESSTFPEKNYIAYTPLAGNITDEIIEL